MGVRIGLCMPLSIGWKACKLKARLAFRAEIHSGFLNAQLARAPARHAGGQRFKSSIAHSYWITTYGEPIIFSGGTGRDAWQNTGDFFMPKKRPEPFWRAERKCWFVQLGKRQVKLSPHETEAWRLYHELMAKPAKQ